MISFKQFQRFFVIASLAILITTTVTISFTPSQSWLATTLIPFFRQSQTSVAMNGNHSISNNNIEDKTQKLNDNIIDDRQAQVIDKTIEPKN